MVAFATPGAVGAAAASVSVTTDEIPDGMTLRLYADKVLLEIAGPQAQSTTRARREQRRAPLRKRQRAPNGTSRVTVLFSPLTTRAWR